MNLQNAGVGKLRSMKEAAAACEPVVALAIARKQLGHWPSQSEYAQHWKISERTAQYEWALFRKAFPEEESPERLAKQLYAEVGADRIEDRSAAFSVPMNLVTA